MSCTLTSCNYMAPRISIWVTTYFTMANRLSTLCSSCFQSRQHLKTSIFSSAIWMWLCHFSFDTGMQFKISNCSFCRFEVGIAQKQIFWNTIHGTGNPWNGQMGKWVEEWWRHYSILQSFLSVIEVLLFWSISCPSHIWNPGLRFISCFQK